MKRVVRLTAVAGLAVGLVMSAVVGASASAPTASAATAAPVASLVGTSADPALDGAKFKPRTRFAREFIREGAADTSVYDIDHVRELQYRLTWAGTYSGPITGTFDRALTRAVRRYQRRNGLRVSGAASFQTWAKLIPQTIRARRAIPRRCKLRNVTWHACYDRSTHQVTLWRKDVLWNSWLVRGGGPGKETRLGTNTIFKRSKDHVSSIYGSPMPYAQFFDGGQAFHGSSKMIDPFVEHSAGCINMYIEDARQLWQLTSRDPMDQMKVTVYGAWS
jgi:hypothetical protein